jgi:tetratricopeptide (TPR) repeat protein
MSEVGGLTTPQIDALFAQWAEARAIAPLAAAIEKDRANPKGYVDRGEWYAQRGRWTQAAADFAEAVRLGPDDHYQAFRLCSLLATTDPAAYRRHSQAMLQRWGSTDDPTFAERTVKGCLLLADSADDTQRIAKLVDTFVRAGEGHQYYRYFLLARGLAAYRGGDYELALDSCRGAQALFLKNGTGNLYIAPALSVQAMALQRQQQPEEARAKLAGARLAIEQLPAEGDVGTSWHDWLIAQLLFREAQSLIEGAPAAPDKAPTDDPTLP